MIAIYLLLALFAAYNFGLILVDLLDLQIEPRLFFAALHTLLIPAALVYFNRRRHDLPPGFFVQKTWWRSWYAWLPGIAVVMANLIVLTAGTIEGRELDFLSWTFVLVVVWVPIAEEIVFRMGILTALARRFHDFSLNLYIGALIFMLAHGTLIASGVFVPSPAPTGGVFLLGLLTGIIFIESKSIAPAIFLHAACNATGYIFPWFNPKLIEPIRWLYL